MIGQHDVGPVAEMGGPEIVHEQITVRAGRALQPRLVRLHEHRLEPHLDGEPQQRLRERRLEDDDQPARAQLPITPRITPRITLRVTHAADSARAAIPPHFAHRPASLRRRVVRARPSGSAAI